MKLSKLLTKLHTLSPIKLFKLETAVTDLLRKDDFVKAHKSTLRTENTVDYFHSGYRQMRVGVIRYLGEDNVTLYDDEAGTDITVPYFSVVVPNPEKSPQFNLQPRPSYSTGYILEIGTLVAFLDEHNRVQIGEVFEQSDLAIGVFFKGKIVQVPYQDCWEAYGVNY